MSVPQIAGFRKRRINRLIIQKNYVSRELFAVPGVKGGLGSP
jgi:hypothetical protein